MPPARRNQSSEREVVKAYLSDGVGLAVWCHEGGGRWAVGGVSSHNLSGGGVCHSSLVGPGTGKGKEPESRDDGLEGLHIDEA